MAAALQHIADTWCAELTLRFERRQDRTVLATRRHVGPLVVQRPFYPEGDVCHVYLVHPPGGIVGGDRLRLEATLGDSAHAVITTPAATKLYRAVAGRHATLDQTLHVRAATLEWLPQETIYFRDAQAFSTTRVDLVDDSRFIGWELACYGRPAGNELFESGRTRQRFELWIDGQPALLDRLRIDGSSMTMKSPWGLSDHTLLGTLLAYPANNADLDAAREHLMFACTLVDRVLSCRLASSDTDEAKRSFIALWGTLRRRIVGREAVAPRIWAT